MKASGRYGDGQDAHLSLRCAVCGDLVFPADALAVWELAHAATVHRVAEAVARWRSRGHVEALVMQAWHFVDAPTVLERVALAGDSA
ncbi:MAG: hypothetical protein H6741_27325 [Alphaproteobacteria bacterium]|nr:hypothetical protein [Alphaproteobacteria bacterium]